MKIKVTSIILFVWTILVAIDAQFWGLIKIPDSLFAYMGSTSRFMVGIIGVMLTVWLILFILRRCGNVTKAFDNDKLIISFIRFYAFSIFFVGLLTFVFFSYQQFRVTLRYTFQYLILVLVLPLLFYMIVKGPKKIFNILNIITFCSNALYVAQAYFYNRDRLIFLYDMVNPKNIRNNSIRISLGAFNSIFILYNFDQLFFHEGTIKKKVGNLVALIMGLYALVYVEQTRALILILIGCMLLGVANVQRNNFIKSVLIILTAIAILDSTDLISNIITSFSSSGLSRSTVSRMYSYNYYWHYFLNHPVFGFGFAQEGAYFHVIHGPAGTAFVDDTGIVGQLAVLGIFGLIINGWLLWRFLYITYKTRSTFLMMLSLYFIGTSISLSILDPQRIIAAPFLLAFFEYKYIQYKKIRFKYRINNG